MKSKRDLIKRIVSAILTVVLILSAILCFTVVLKTVGNDRVPDLFGFRFFYIVTGSMEPALHIGETIIVRERQEYEEGDVITYIAGDSFEIAGQPITHRVVEVLRDSENRITGYITRGDAAVTLDPEVNPDSIYGKMVWSSGHGEGDDEQKGRFWNTILSFLSDRNGFFLLLVLPVAFFAVICMKDFLKAQKKLLEEKQKEQMGLSEKTNNDSQKNDDRRNGHE